MLEHRGEGAEPRRAYHRRRGAQTGLSAPAMGAAGEGGARPGGLQVDIPVGQDTPL